MAQLSFQEFYNYLAEKQIAVQQLSSSTQDDITTTTFSFFKNNLNAIQSFQETPSALGPTLPTPNPEFTTLENMLHLPEKKPEDRTFSYQNLITVLGNIKSIFQVKNLHLLRKDDQNYLTCTVSKDFQTRSFDLKIFLDPSNVIYVDYQSYLDALNKFSSITFPEFQQVFSL